MRVLLINGSPRERGCTHTALDEIGQTLAAEGVDAEIAWLGADAIQDCTACGACRGNGGLCIFGDDAINGLIERAKAADGFVFGTPVYYAHPSGRVLSALDRMFYAGSAAFRYKPGAAVASARRAGTTASLDALNKYFTINQMPVVSSFYWNMIHGNTPEEAREDLEGMQIMRGIGRNMAWLLKCIALGREAGVVPSMPEKRVSTNFIRDI